MKIKSYTNFINEGGWSSAKTQSTVLTPHVLKLAHETLQSIFKEFNAWLDKEGMPPMKPIRAVGSGSYWEDDLVNQPDKLYGDIDYLFEYPILEFDPNPTNNRKNELDTIKLYNEMLLDWIKAFKPNSVDYEESVKISSPTSIKLLIIPKDDMFIQADILITSGIYKDWAIGRYTPVKDIKGFVIGYLYKAIGLTLTMSFLDRGVRAKFIDGNLVSFRKRKNVEEMIISLDFGNFLYDIAEWAMEFDGKNKKKMKVHKLLKQQKGLTRDNVTLEKFCVGIKGLAYTLEMNDLLHIFSLSSADDMINKTEENYINSISDVRHSSKFKKAETAHARAAMEKIFKFIDYGIETVSRSL